MVLFINFFFFFYSIYALMVGSNPGLAIFCAVINGIAIVLALGGPDENKS